MTEDPRGPRPAQRMRRAAEAIGDPHRPWSTRLDGGVLIGLALLTVVLRWPLRSRYLNGWDSTSFALAVEHYDVMAQRPHAPGYPVYVALAKILYAWTGDANAALVWLSILFSAGAVALLYGFLREFASARAALAAAFLFLLAPLFVFNGVIALSYTGEALASVGVAWLAWRTRRNPTRSRVLLMGATTALAIGLRQSLLFFLGPLTLYALLGQPRRASALLPRLSLAAAAGGLTAALWFIPMVASTTGGWDGYRRASALQSGWVVVADSVFVRGPTALREHFARESLFLHAETRYLLPTLIVLVVLAAFLARPAFRASWRDALAWPPGTAVFLAVWLLPSLLFHLFIFNGWDKGPTGYILVLLPGVYALFATLGDALLRLIESRPRRPAVGSVATWLALPLLLLPAPALEAAAHPLLAQEVEAHDRWADSWALLPHTFPPNETAILAWYSWAHVKWYFPDYVVFGYFPIPRNQDPPDWELTLRTEHHEDDVLYYEAHLRGPHQPPHALPPQIRTIVLFDFQLAGRNDADPRLADDVPVEEARLDDGTSILFVRADPARPFIEDYYRPLAA